jgi:glucose-1-phosphate cytidylyltransferase
MKAVILAGGLGTRLSEETIDKPKPMVQIGDKPILWHIIKIFSSYNIKEFIICCGHKGEIIKDYFLNYNLYNADFECDLKSNSSKILNLKKEDWNIKLIDTGKNTMTGGRLKKIKKYIGEDENFLFTYGDGVADINIKELIKFHNLHNKIATITATSPPGRFGNLRINNNNQVENFIEKPDQGEAWINGGFFVLNSKVFDYLKDDQTVWENEPLKSLSSQGQLIAYKHYGFWQPMDTIREKNYLNELWQKEKAPWKTW